MMLPRSHMWDPAWDVYDALEALIEANPNQELILNEVDVRRTTGYGLVVRSALRRIGFLNPFKNIWVRLPHCQRPSSIDESDRLRARAEELQFQKMAGAPDTLASFQNAWLTVHDARQV